MKTVIKVLIGFFVFLALIFCLEYLGIIKQGFLGPKQEKVNRNIYEESPSYVQGKIQDLSNYKMQYDQSTIEGDKQIIKNVIRTQFANFNIEDCPDGLKSFLEQMRGY